MAKIHISNSGNMIFAISFCLGVFSCNNNSAINKEDSNTAMQFAAVRESNTPVKRSDNTAAKKINDDEIDLKKFGAKGEGLSSVKEDTKALEDAVQYLNEHNGGKLHIPSCSKFYAYAGDGLLLTDNVEIYGDGEKSHIRHVEPDGSKWYKGVIFYLSTYGPVNKLSIIQQPKYKIANVGAGSSLVKLVNAGEAKKLTAGKVIVLASSPFNKDKDPNKIRYLHIEQNEVTKVAGNTVSLKYPVSVDLTAGGPVIIDVNSGTTTNPVTGAVNRTTKNVQIHDLHFSQGQTNEISKTPLKAAPASVMQLGGTFESKFYNLIMDTHTGISGNMWCHCTFDNLKINATGLLVDWGYGSHNNVFKDITYTYVQSPLHPKIAFMYFSEASHDIVMDNVNASGNWNGSHILLIGNGAKKLSLLNSTFNFPAVNNDDFGITIADQDKSVYSSNITIKNVKIRINKMKRFIRFSGQNDDVDREITLDKVSFDETSNSKQGVDQGFFIGNMKGVKLNDVYENNNNVSSKIKVKKIAPKPEN